MVGDYRPLMAILSDDEVRRAERFVFEKHREHYVVGRARMRQILAAFAPTTASTLELAYENLGKPRFRDEALHAKLRFNFSNSNDRGLLAVTVGEELGVDLERVRPMNDMMGLARRYYAETETNKLFALADQERPAAFFRCWTRKEAYLKAVGKGLTFPLRSVEVTLLNDEVCRILNINSDANEAAAWSLFHLRPYDGFLGALAVRNRSATVSLWDWPNLAL